MRRPYADEAVVGTYARLFSFWVAASALPEQTYCLCSAEDQGGHDFEAVEHFHINSAGRDRVWPCPAERARDRGPSERDRRRYDLHW